MPQLRHTNDTVISHATTSLTKCVTHSLSIPNQILLNSSPFFNEKFCILIQISLKFVPKGPIDNKAALVQVMAWHLKGDKPLSEPMLTQFTEAYK